MKAAARALYTASATEQEAAHWGLTLQEAAEAETCWVWPDNWPIVEAFEAMTTQWRVGMRGATGLDYAVLPVVLRMRGIARADWPDTFYGIRVMESAALDVIRVAK